MNIIPRNTTFEELLHRVSEAANNRALKKQLELVIMLARKYAEVPPGLIENNRIVIRGYIFDVSVEGDIIFLEDFHK